MEQCPKLVSSRILVRLVSFNKSVLTMCLATMLGAGAKALDKTGQDPALWCI